MTVLRIGNSKEALVQGMKLLDNILEVLAKPDARKTLKEAISMTDDEINAANEAKVYVDQAARLRSEIMAEQATAEKMMTEAKAMMQEAKTAQINSKSALVAAESRLSSITEKQSRKDGEHAVKDAALAEKEKKLADLETLLNDRAVKQDAKQLQLDDLEKKLRAKADAASRLMQGM